MSRGTRMGSWPKDSYQIMDTHQAKLQESSHYSQCCTEGFKATSATCRHCRLHRRKTCQSHCWKISQLYVGSACLPRPVPPIHLKEIKKKYVNFCVQLSLPAGRRVHIFSLTEIHRQWKLQLTSSLHSLSKKDLTEILEALCQRTN